MDNELEKFIGRKAYRTGGFYEGVVGTIQRSGGDGLLPYTLELGGLASIGIASRKGIEILDEYNEENNCNSMDGKWIIIFNENLYAESLGLFDSYEKAIEFIENRGVYSAYKEWFKENYGQEILAEGYVDCFVGEIQVYHPSILGHTIIDEIREDAYDFGGDLSEGYLDNISFKYISELSNQLTQVLNEWLEKHKYHPNFYIVRELKKV